MAVLGISIQDLLHLIPWPAILLDRDGEVIGTSDELPGRAERDAPAGPNSLRARLPHYLSLLAWEPPGLDAQEVDSVRTLPSGDAVHERIYVRPASWGACLTVVDRTDFETLQTADVQTTRLAALGFMVAGVCHEISNPLTSIHSHAQLLRSDKRLDHQALARGLDSITANVKRVLDISRRLVTFSRVGDEPYAPFAVDEPINDALRSLRQQGWLDHVDLRLDADPAATVIGNAGQIREVFLNVFLNALQAMGSAGQLVVTTRRKPPSRVEVIIRDSGPGVPVELASRIFEPFFTTKSSGHGTGLGLAISDQFVREHGGAIWAESRPSQGAVFHVELPQDTS